MSTSSAICSGGKNSATPHTKAEVQKQIVGPGYWARLQELMKLLDAHPALEDWRAGGLTEATPDLAVLLGELWTYLEQNLAFYNGQVGAEHFVGSAEERESLRKLADLVGYQPRPATASTIDLSMIVEDEDVASVRVPKGTAFRSEAGEESSLDGPIDVAPQVFESSVEIEASPVANAWSLAPVHPQNLGDKLYLSSVDARLTRDQIALFVYESGSVTKTMARAVREIESIQATDSERYVQVDLVPGPEPSEEGLEEDEKTVLRTTYSAISGGNTGKAIGVALEIEPATKVLNGLRVVSPSLQASAGSLQPAFGHEGTFKIKDSANDSGVDLTGKKVLLYPIVEVKGKSITINLDYTVASLRKNERVVFQHKDNYLGATVTEVKHGILAVPSEAVVEQIRGASVGLYEPQNSGSDQPQYILGGNKSGESDNDLDIAVISPARVTQVTLSVRDLYGHTAVLSNALSNPTEITLHYNLVDAGTLVNPALPSLSSPDLTAGVPIEINGQPISNALSQEEINSLHEDRKAARRYLLQSGDKRQTVEGFLEKDGDGLKWRMVEGQLAEDAKLSTPITIYGNVIRATRGESVVDEILGSGDASQTFQSFELSRGPLTMFDDATAPHRLRADLQITVSGAEWTRVATLQGQAANARVYTLRHSGEGDDAVTQVIFGDGKTGARLPTGVNNIIANYRVGAGAQKPPRNAEFQLSGSVDGVRRVVAASTAFGGSDAESADEIRQNVPESLRFLDNRIINGKDLEAMARRYAGVYQAKVRHAYSKEKRCNVHYVDVIVDDEGFDTKALKKYLLDLTPEGFCLEVVQVPSVWTWMIINLEAKEEYRHDPGGVLREVLEQLTKSPDGVLLPENAPIGGTLFASPFVSEVLKAKSVRRVVDFQLDYLGVGPNDEPVGPTGNLPLTLASSEGAKKHFYPRWFAVKICLGEHAAGVITDGSSPRLRHFEPSV